MLRRKFITLFSSFFGSSFIFPVLIVRPLSASPQLSKGKITVINMQKGAASGEIPYKTKYNKIYISLEDFCRQNDYGIFTNRAKHKTVIYVGREKVKFTADNVFVILNNEQILQYNYEPFWENGELWVSARNLADLFSQYTSHKMEFADSKLQLTVGKKDVNISNMKISPKDNGTLIHIFTERAFKEKSISLKVVNGWLHVDVIGGKADSDLISRKIAGGLISEIQAIQFEQMVSLAFKLRKNVVSKSIIFDQESDDILVSLITDQDIVKEEQPKDNLEREKDEWLIDTIVIDPGHGGRDPGAIGYKGLLEKDIVLPVALKLGKEINRRLPRVKVVYTRKTDVFIPLWKRPKIANRNNGKLFVSLHCNSNESSKPRGFETYFLSSENDERARDVVLKENGAINFEGHADRKHYEGINFILATMAQNAFIKQSQYLASKVQKAVVKKLKPDGLKDRGVKQAGFFVMVGATMPNILIEMGYISNKYEAKLLKKKSTQTKMADAICNGIIKYKTDIESAI